jgi:hypothetical protein
MMKRMPRSKFRQQTMRVLDFVFQGWDFVRSFVGGI